MAAATYRFLRSQDGDEPTLGEEEMTRADAFALLGVDHLLHTFGGWSVHRCSCGYGFHAVKGDTRRQVHVVPDDLPGVAQLVIASQPSPLHAGAVLA